jgi:phosphomethylpyrimidine synthase
MHGADFLCMVSPSEHLALPLIEDIVEGTRVAKISAHIGDLVRVKDGYKMPRERQMADARRRLDWKEQFDLALFPDAAKTIHARDGELDTCSMCGDLCAVKMMQDIFEKSKK